MDEKVLDPVGAEEQKEETEEQTETADKTTESKTAGDMCSQPSPPGRLRLPRARSSSAPPETKNIPEENIAKRVIALPVPASALPNTAGRLSGAKNVPEQKSNKFPVPSPKPCEEAAVVRPSGSSGPLPGTRNVPEEFDRLREQKRQATLADILRDCCSAENEQRRLFVERKPPVNSSRSIVFRGATTSRIIPQQPYINAMIPVPPALPTPATPSPTPEKEESFRDRNKRIEETRRMIIAAVDRLPYARISMDRIVSPTSASASGNSGGKGEGKPPINRKQPHSADEKQEAKKEPPNTPGIVVTRGTVASTRVVSHQPFLNGMIPFQPQPPVAPPNTPTGVEPNGHKYHAEVIIRAAIAKLPQYKCVRERFLVPPLASPSAETGKDGVMLFDRKQPIHIPGTGSALSRIPTIFPVKRIVIPPSNLKRPTGKPPAIPAPKPKNGSNIPSYLKRCDINPQFTPTASWRFDTVRSEQVAFNRSLDRVEVVPKSPPSNSKDSGKESDEDVIINVTDVDSPEKKQPKPQQNLISPPAEGEYSQEPPAASTSTNITSSCTQTTPSPMAIVKAAGGAKVLPTVSPSTILKGTGGAKVVPTLTKGIHRSYSLVYKPAFPGAPGNSVSPLKRHLTPGKPTRVVAIKRPAGNAEAYNTSPSTSDSKFSPSSSFLPNNTPNCRTMPTRFQPRPPLLLPPNKFKPLPFSPQNKGPSPAMVYASSRHRLVSDALPERKLPPILSGDDDFVAKRPRFEFDDEGYQAPKVYTLEELRQKFKDATNGEAERHRSGLKNTPRTDLVTCSLCGNQICISRFTNLTNHVKRHCAVKQYRCNTCDYHHNECAKVRLHMFNNHLDNTDPQNKASEELQNAWKTMLKKCFPEQYNNLVSEFSIPMPKRVHRRGSTGYVWKKVEAPGPPPSFWATFNSDTRIEIDPEFPMETLDTEHVCRTCGEMVEADKTYLPIYEHLKEKHADICLIFQCQSCGYSNCEEGIVKWHVCTRHHDSVCVIEIPFGKRLDVFVRKFFPSFAHALKAPDVDLEEAFFLAQSAAVKVVWYAGNRGHSLPSLKIPRLLRDVSVESEGAATDFVVRYNLKSSGENTTPPPSPASPVVVVDLDEEEEEQKPEVEKDLLAEKRKERKRSSLGENDVFCELCAKVLHWKNKKTMANLLAHAKRHFRIKQFQCKYCEYDNSEAIHVRTHHLTRHNDANSAPKSNNSDYMQESWRRVMKQCFPPLADRINTMKFNKSKRYNQAASPPTPSHNYGTRNNTPKPEKSREEEG